MSEMFKLPEPTGTEKELVDEVTKFWSDPEFILGVRLHLKTDDERKMVIDAIKSGDLKDSDDIILFTLDIHNDRQEHSPKEDVA